MSTKCLGLNELDFTKWIEKPVSARISKSSCTQGKKGFTQVDSLDEQGKKGFTQVDSLDEQGKKGFTQVDSLDEQNNTIQKWATNYKLMSQ